MLQLPFPSTTSLKPPYHSALQDPLLTEHPNRLKRSAFCRSPPGTTIEQTSGTLTQSLSEKRSMTKIEYTMEASIINIFDTKLLKQMSYLN